MPQTQQAEDEENAELAHELLCDIEDSMKVCRDVVSTWEAVFVYRTRGMLRAGKQISSRRLAKLLLIHMKAG